MGNVYEFGRCTATEIVVIIPDCMYMLCYPIKTIEGLGRIAKNPKETDAALLETTKNAYKEDTTNALGFTIGTVVGFGGVVKGASKASKIAKASKAVQSSKLLDKVCSPKIGTVVGASTAVVAGPLGQEVANDAHEQQEVKKEEEFQTRVDETIKRLTQ